MLERSSIRWSWHLYCKEFYNAITIEWNPHQHKDLNWTNEMKRMCHSKQLWVTHRSKEVMPACQNQRRTMTGPLGASTRPRVTRKEGITNVAVPGVVAAAASRSASSLVSPHSRDFVDIVNSLRRKSERDRESPESHISFKDE